MDISCQAEYYYQEKSYERVEVCHFRKLHSPAFTVHSFSQATNYFLFFSKKEEKKKGKKNKTVVRLRVIPSGLDIFPGEIKSRIHQTLMLRSQKFWNVCSESQDPEQTLSSCRAPAENRSQNKQRQKLHLTDPVETAVTT